MAGARGKAAKEAEEAKGVSPFGRGCSWWQEGGGAACYRGAKTPVTLFLRVVMVTNARLDLP